MEPYQQLEKEWSKFTGAKHSVSCNSGTSALHLSLLALGIKKGDKVLIPDFTMAAIPFAVSYVGAWPIFCDVDANNYGLDYLDFVDKISQYGNEIKAIILVHTYGRVSNQINNILKLAKDTNIPVIEDACEAQGAIYKSKATMTVYSFYRNKIISAEEGGIITTDNKDLAEKVNYYKNMCFSKEHDYFHKHIGFNYRMPNAQAKLALKSLKNYPKNLKRRREIESLYNELLFLPDVKRQAVWFFEYPLSFMEIPFKEELLKAIPEARHAFKPVSTFPMFSYIKRYRGLPMSQILSDSLILLPAHPKLTNKRIKEICKTINNIIYGE